MPEENEEQVHLNDYGDGSKPKSSRGKFFAVFVIIILVVIVVFTVLRLISK